MTLWRRSDYAIYGIQSSIRRGHETPMTLWRRSYSGRQSSIRRGHETPMTLWLLLVSIQSIYLGTIALWPYNCGHRTLITI